ncbi:hypothetical protein ACGFSB_36140 [Streptomyces sp. NPDC048441]|uniref:hypothetical protein n=1 Tax=Streptomyces sp. NPDC048441 TaxID=3365552 RepID=UPI0037180028
MLLRTRRAKARTFFAAVLAACTLTMSSPPAHAGEVAGTLFITWPGGQEERTEVNFACYEVQPAGNTTITNALYMAAVQVYAEPNCPGSLWDPNLVWRNETDTFPHVASYMVVRAPG